MAQSNAVLIGRKSAMNYVLACLTLFHGGVDEVSIKARGRAISRAIDVTEILRRRFMTNVKVADIKISTEQLMSDEGGAPTNVSAIEIILTK